MNQTLIYENRQYISVDVMNSTSKFSVSINNHCSNKVGTIFVTFISYFSFDCCPPTFVTRSFSLTSAGWKRKIERTLGNLAYCLFVIKLRTIDLRYLFIFVLSVSFLDDSATPNLLSVSFWKMYWILIFQWDDEDLGEIPWTCTILYMHGIANIYFELDSVYIVLICWVKER